MKVRYLLIGLALALMLVSLPHALEDLHYGVLSQFGITSPVAAVLVIVSYALLLTGIALVGRGSSRGAPLLAIVGTIWCAGAIIVHGHDMIFAGPEYRHGLISKLLELLIIVLGGSLAVLGVRARVGLAS